MTETVHVCWTDAEADVVVSFLRSRGVMAQRKSEAVRALYGLTLDGLGQVDIVVPAQDAGSARVLLGEMAAAANPAPGPEDTAGHAD